MSETSAILRLFGTIPCWKERLKMYLTGQKMFSETIFTTEEEISSIPGDHFGLKLLKTFSNSLSCRILSSKAFYGVVTNFSKFFKVCGIEDVSFISISLKNLLNPFAILYWSKT